MWLRQSTASQEALLGPFLDSGDGNTAETLLTIANTDIKLWREGATTEANKNSGGATHIADGRYYIVLDATDTATLGKLEINVHVAGALAVRREYMVVPAMVYDSLVLGTDTINVDTTLINGDVSAAELSDLANAYAAANLACNITGSVNSIAAGGIAAASFAAGAINAAAVAADVTTEIAAGLSIPTAAQNAAALMTLADGVESGLTPKHALQAIFAATAGKSAGGGKTFRNFADNKNRIVSTVDSSSNRTAITYSFD